VTGFLFKFSHLLSVFDGTASERANATLNKQLKREPQQEDKKMHAKLQRASSCTKSYFLQCVVKSNNSTRYLENATVRPTLVLAAMEQK
jgi:hypothetical protein